MGFSKVFVFASFGKFGYRSSEIFQNKPEFLNSQNFREKVWKKVPKFKFGKKFGCYSIMYVIFENFKKST